MYLCEQTTPNEKFQLENIAYIEEFFFSIVFQQSWVNFGFLFFCFFVMTHQTWNIFHIVEIAQTLHKDRKY